MDAAGLGVFFTALEIPPPSGLLGVIAPGDQLRKLFHLVCLDDDPRFRTFDSRKDVVSVLDERPLRSRGGRSMRNADRVA